MSIETVMDSIHDANETALGAVEQAAIDGTEPAITPFDASCIALMDRVAAFFGECAGHPDFCGLGIDEQRDHNGQLLSLRLVPCELVSGEPVRRVGR